MQVEKQVLKLRYENKSQRSIAQTLKVSRNTVSKIFQAADPANLFWDRAQIMDDTDIHNHLFPEDDLILEMKNPDFDYIHKELLRQGVTLHGLWQEYVAECKEVQLPFYHRSYFCEMYQALICGLSGSE